MALYKNFIIVIPSYRGSGLIGLWGKDAHARFISILGMRDRVVEFYGII